MRRHVAMTALLYLGIIGFNTAVSANDVKVAYMTCNNGDRFNISLDNQSITWEVSNDVVSIEDGIVFVNREGSCELKDTNTGFTIKLNSYGKSTKSKVIDIDYSSNGSKSSSTVKRDKTVNFETIEVNSMINIENSIIPESQQDISETNISLKEKGNYIVENSSGISDVVKVVEPTLNQYLYQGSVGQFTDVFIENLDVTETFKSSNEDVAVVDSNGHVELVGAGEANIIVSTENNDIVCKIISLQPTVSEDDIVIQHGQTYKINVENNFANLPVKYYVVSGNGTVNSNGLVSVDDEVIIKTVIGDNFEYNTKICSTTVHGEYWNAMQPAIQRCLGTPYVFGGETPGVGLDCSAYVSYVYRSVGLVDGRYTAQGLYDKSTMTDEPLPGDLVFFTGTYDTSEYISHIGIYAGNGEMYHNGDPNRKVSLNTNYWKTHLVGYGTMITTDMQGPEINEYYTDKNVTGYSEEQLELIWAIVAQECSTDYEGALAVISCAMNRAEINYNWYGRDVLSQLTAPSQFCYSVDVSDTKLWQNRLHGNVNDFVKKAVYDCINKGIRNHSFLSFRSNYADDRVNIGDNWYFNE